MKSLTVCYITCRKNHQFEWFMESLCSQIRDGDEVHVIQVNEHQGVSETLPPPKVVSPPKWSAVKSIRYVCPKPSVWRGKYRLTKEPWWAISNAKNTGICLCETEWYATVDDRSVLVPTWLEAVKLAMQNNYVVAGAYEKVHNLKVENGVILSYDKPGDGMDFRYPKNGRLHPQMIGGNSFYGCTGALPMEWCLEVNGFDETCDSLGLEDCLFGSMLDNLGKPFFYDPRMKLVEDRTPSELEPPPLRTDKGVSPNDRSHMLKRNLENLKRASHEWDLRTIREKVLKGGEFPIPSGPIVDYFDGERLQDMIVR